MDKKLEKYFRTKLSEISSLDIYIGGNYETAISLLHETYLAGAHAQAEADRVAVENVSVWDVGDDGINFKDDALTALSQAEIKE